MSAISDFQALIDDHVAPWAASGSCWSKGAEIGKLVLEAYKAQKVFLDKAIRMKKPNEEQVCRCEYHVAHTTQNARTHSWASCSAPRASRWAPFRS